MLLKNGIFTAAIFLISFSLLAQDKSHLAVGWELWYPYQYHNSDNKLVGLDIEIFNKIVKEAGYQHSFTELPWKRHLQYIQLGKMDVALGASYSNDRQQYAFFTKPYRTEQVKLYVRKGQSKNMPLATLADLITSNYMIGVEGGYYYGKAYKELIKLPEFQSHISEVIDLEENVKLTLKGHLDGFLVDPVTMQAFAHKYHLEQEFEPHTVEIYQDEIYIMLSKKTLTNEDLSRFNQAIELLKSNGEIDKITHQWTSLQASKR